MAERVLIVMRDDELRQKISVYLSEKGFDIRSLYEGKKALEMIEYQTFAFLIVGLDLLDMPLDCLCHRIVTKVSTPLIVVDQAYEEKNLLSFMTLGADDYLAVPFSFKELLIRMLAIHRRVSDNRKMYLPMSYNGGELLIEPHVRGVIKDGRAIQMTPIEWKILQTMAAYPLKIFTREELLSAAFEEDYDGYDRVVDTHIKNIRKKIETDSRHPAYIQTVHGVGYRFGGEKDYQTEL